VGCRTSPPGSRRCEAPSGGATTCWTRGSKPCLRGWAYSWGVARLKLSRRYAIQESGVRSQESGVRDGRKLIPDSRLLTPLQLDVRDGVWSLVTKSLLRQEKGVN